jgi:hypothetical protein
MSIKVAVLKSGEQIISDVKEMVVDDKVVGYYFNKACSIQLFNPTERENAKTAFDIRLYPWIPFAKDEDIPIALDAVTTFVDPVDMLFDMYQNNVVIPTKKEKQENE